MSADPVVQVRRIDHVGVAVTDLDAAAAFFAATFGLASYHRERNDDQGVSEAMLAPAPRGITDRTQPALQLLAPLDDQSSLNRFLERRGPGLQQLAFEVDDVDAAAHALREQGIRLLFDTARPGTSGSRVNFVHPGDAYGVLVELVERTEADHTRNDD